MAINTAGPRLFLEPYGSPALGRLARLIAWAKGADPLAPVTVVVPTQYAGLSLRRRLAEEGGLLNVRFMVPARLAEMLGALTVAGRGKAPLSPLVELATIRSLASKLAGQGPLPNTSHPRLHSYLRRTFRQLDKLSEPDLVQIEQADALREQVVKWYRLSSAALSGFYTREELARAAAISVEDGKASGPLRDLGSVICFLVQDLSPGEVALVNALGKAGVCAVILGRTSEDGPDSLANNLASRLEASLGPASASRLSTTSGYGADHLVSAPDEYQEVRWTIRQIFRLAQEGVPFHRMAVFYRQRDPYAILLPSQLGLADIPVAGPDPRILRDTPAGRLLVSYLQVIEADLSRDSVMKWLAEAPVKLATDAGPTQSEGLLWEIVSRKAGVVKGIAQWNERIGQHLDNLAREIEEADLREEVSPARLQGLKEEYSSGGRLVGFMGNLVDSGQPSEGSSWGSYVKWSKSILKRYARGLEESAPQHQAGLERVTRILDEMASLDQVAPGPDLPGFRLMLEEALEAPSGRTGRTGHGVFVAPVGAAQGMDFHTVFLVGMAEGAFPPAPPVDPILPDHLMERLDSVRNLPHRKTQRIEERRVYLAAMAAGQRRILTYPRTDSAAQRSQHPSPWFLDEAGRLHRDPVGSVDITKLGQEPWLSVIESAQHGLTYTSGLAPADLHDYDLASISRWIATGRRLETHYLALPDSRLHRALRLLYARKATSFSAWDGRLSDLKGRSRRLGVSSNRPLSATSLERWARCPFAFFLGNILGLAALETPEEVTAISSLERGSLLHKVLERLVLISHERGDLPDYGKPWETSHYQLVRQIAEEEFATAQAKGITGKRLLWEAAKEEMLHDLSACLEEDSRWRAERSCRPIFVEKRFGFDVPDTMPPLSIEIASGVRVRFRGLIDRVDSNQAGTLVTVIDYKSGSSSSYRDMDRDPLAAGRRLQLPIYGLAIRALTSATARIEAQYWFMTSRGNFVRKVAPLHDVEEKFLEVIGTIVDGIQEGIFPAVPSPAGRENRPANCVFCDFDRVCPADRDVLWERKRQDPSLNRYLTLLIAPDSEESGS